MSKSPINFGVIPGVANNLMNPFGGNMFGSVGAHTFLAQQIQQQQAAAQAASQAQSASGGPGLAGLDPNNSTGSQTFAINPNANSYAVPQEATGAPGELTQFADGSEGYRVNRFGGFAGPTGGGTMPSNVATANQHLANNFSTNTTKVAAQMFGNGTTRFQPRKKLITL